jgi:metal-responsive CopG/Arc/MetJ family transcriptional regulator
MHVHNFFFPDELFNEIKDLSDETGAPVSELVRRACKEYLERKQKHEKAKK